VKLSLTKILNTAFPGNNVQVHDTSNLRKMKVKLISDLVKNIPFMADTEPEKVLMFLISVKEDYDLGLVTDFELLSLLVTRKSGQVTQIFGFRLTHGSTWSLVCSELLSTFLMPRIKERFLLLCILHNFQAAGENRNKSLMSVLAAVDILGYDLPESLLVQGLDKK
jgi:hypothetical protein